MNDQFLNRLAMHRTVLETLDKPEHKAVWEAQPPPIFGTKVGTLRTKVAKLGELVTKHQTELSGIAEQKLKEEKELEDAAYELGSALAAYFDDQNHADKAAEVELSRSGWRRLRDEQLLARAKTVSQRLSEELIANAVQLTPYGLAVADKTTLEKEIADYEKIIHSPQTAIAGRRAVTVSLRPHFREVSELLASLDKLVLRFGSTEAGQAFVTAYQSARIVRESGGNPGPQTSPATPAPNPQPSQPS
jgi:hypothetical protein